MSCLRINERSLYLFLLDRRNDRQFSWAKHDSLSMVLRMAESSMFGYKSSLTFPAIFASNAKILIKKMTKVTVRVVFKKWGILALRLSTILCFSEKRSEMIKVSGSKRILLAYCFGILTWEKSPSNHLHAIAIINQRSYVQVACTPCITVESEQ